MSSQRTKLVIPAGYYGVEISTLQIIRKELHIVHFRKRLMESKIDLCDCQSSDAEVYILPIGNE